MEEFDNLKAVFFVSEEVGGIGSSNCDINFFNNSKFVLQCDRQSNSDFITEIYGTTLCSRKFMFDVDCQSYGYKKGTGMFTDVYNLKSRGLNISVCNISCGYYNPHQSTEYTKLMDLHKCYAFVAHILRDCKEVYHHKYEKTYRNRYVRNYHDWYEDSVEKNSYDCLFEEEVIERRNYYDDLEDVELIEPKKEKIYIPRVNR